MEERKENFPFSIVQTEVLGWLWDTCLGHASIMTLTKTHPLTIPQVQENGIYWWTRPGPLSYMWAEQWGTDNHLNHLGWVWKSSFLRKNQGVKVRRGNSLLSLWLLIAPIKLCLLTAVSLHMPFPPPRVIFLDTSSFCKHWLTFPLFSEAYATLAFIGGVIPSLINS